MYSFRGEIKTYDVYFPEQQTFLFRDQGSIARRSGLNIHTIFYALNSLSTEDFAKQYSVQLKEFCKCTDVHKAELQGSLYEHYVQKKDLQFQREVLK